MKVSPTSLPGVLVVEPIVYGDDRGFFYESFNEQRFNELIQADHPIRFVQDNHSRSVKNAIRGLHYQIKNAQGKLVRVVAGEIFDVAVDLRQSSPAFGKWHGLVLSAENKKQLWIPQGFAHGFVALSDVAEVLYKTTEYWSPQDERCLAWNDPTVSVNWPIQGLPVLSTKDMEGRLLGHTEVFP